jgi:NADH dehydrogenase [ubiquinone] 1 alpha subcomplex assembly factor 1
MLRAAGMPKSVLDFSCPNAVKAWHAIDDRVMGGVSRSTLRSDPGGHAVFEGEVSLERNGGFASVRSSPGDRGLPGAEACLTEVRGDPKQFKLSLLTDHGFDGVNFQASFNPAGGTWHILHLPVAGFRATFRGREVPDVPPLNPARIHQVGLTFAARQAGTFELHVRRISLA